MRIFASSWRRASATILVVICILHCHPANAQQAQTKIDDILWDMGTLRPIVWGMQAGTVASENYIGTAMPIGWNIAAVGNFSGSGRTDVFWTATDGASILWINQGNGQINAVFVAGKAPTSGKAWVGDFYGDGHSDILWEIAGSAPVVWRMNGSNIVSVSYLGTAMPIGWHITSVGDFDGNELANIVWTAPNGTSIVWMNQGSGQMAATSLLRYGLTPQKAWVGDFNGDGKDDILWDAGTGRPILWTMNGANVVSGSYIGAPMPQGWYIAAVGDFTGSGLTDILWSDSNGSTVLWLNQGSGQVAAVSLAKYGNILGKAWIGHFPIGSISSGNGSTQSGSAINGTCGSANGLLSTVVPAANLCSTGSVTGLSGNGPWTWTCAGSNGGTASQCSAPVLTATAWVSFTAAPNLSLPGSIAATAPIVTMETVLSGNDATPVLAAAIAKAKTQSAGTLIIPTGTYTFQTLNSAIDGTAAHIVLEDLSNVTVQGNGSTLVFTKNAPGIYMAGSQGIQLQNFNIEYQLNSASQ